MIVIYQVCIQISSKYTYKEAIKNLPDRFCRKTGKTGLSRRDILSFILWMRNSSKASLEGIVLR